MGKAAADAADAATEVVVTGADAFRADVAAGAAVDGI